MNVFLSLVILIYQGILYQRLAYLQSYLTIIYDYFLATSPQYTF